MRAQKFGGIVGEAGAGIEHITQTVGDGRKHHDVRLDSAAAGHAPAFVGAEFAFLVGMRGGAAELEACRIQRLLDGAPAGRVIQRRGERQARALGQRVDALHQALPETRHAEDGGAVVILHGAGKDLRGFRRLRLREGIATLLTLALVSAYALLTGFGVPVERALLMTAVFLLARLLTRDRNTLNALGAAALAVLIWSPRALFEASFQMTFLASVAIAGIAMPLGERTFLPCAHAARNLRDPWRDTALPPHLAHFRMMLRLWSESQI